MCGAVCVRGSDEVFKRMAMILLSKKEERPSAESQMNGSWEERRKEP